ncbi:hypothetical protein G9A89_012885 [Geosiphon pyriformis]|nr:hypothetical protein G9A89_012885 [Geosiphon pyriformis]
MDNRKWDSILCLACENTLLDEGMWKNISGRGEAYNKTCQYTILINHWQALRCLEGYSHNEDEIWRMAYAISEDATTEELREIKNNPLFLPKPEYVQTFNVFGNIKDNSEEFHEEKQEECLAQLNTQLCDYCLIPCDFQYCNKCNLIYDSPPRMIYTISKKEKPISNCTSESESLINCDSNSDNNNDNNDSSSIQNSNNNNNNSNSDPNSNTNYEQYIALPDLSKEQELK